jgi:hypothetical protein
MTTPLADLEAARDAARAAHLALTKAARVHDEAERLLGVHGLMLRRLASDLGEAFANEAEADYLAERSDA